MRSAIVTSLFVFLLLPPALPALASQDILLGFGALPTAQGFTWNAVGSHAGVAEASVFTADGAKLVQDTIGQALGTAGGGLFYTLPGIIVASESSELHVTARCLQVQGSSVYPAGQGGVGFGITTGSVQYAFTITPTAAYVLGPGGWITVAGAFDNTQFADWTLAYAPPSSCQLYRNGALVSATSGGGALALNRLFFGDLTGGGNARAEITTLHFLQGGAVSVEGASWSGIKALFR